LAKNTKPYPNVIPIEAAIWPRAEQLAVDNSGPAWGFQVTANGTAGMPSVYGITIDDVLKQWGGGAPVDLLKIDIEGAEKELVSSPSDSWLARTRLIVIELHDRMVPGCEQALERATNGFRFLKMIKGEDTILVRNDLNEVNNCRASSNPQSLELLNAPVGELIAATLEMVCGATLAPY
jgi:FkbM family methyltransferase